MIRIIIAKNYFEKCVSAINNMVLHVNVNLIFYFYQQMEHLQSFIKDCDRKIQIAKKRLEETQDDHDNVPEVGVKSTVQV